MKKNNPNFRLSQVTKRLDHEMPDPEISAALNEQASRDLMELCRKLDGLIPDPSLSPEEKLERLARVVQDRVPFHEHLLPANTKLHKIKSRLNELIPGEASAVEKIDQLVAALENSTITTEDTSIVKRLEQLGDRRAGVNPII